MLIEERLAIEGDPTEVWERLSDVGRIPEFWRGTRSLEVLGRKTDAEGREVVKARVRFAFGGAGEAEITVDGAKRTVSWAYHSGPFKGTQTASVVGRALEARWDIRFNGLYKLTTSWTAGHFRSGTVHALERLRGERAPDEAASQA